MENVNLTDSILIGNRNIFALDLKDIFDYFGKVCITSNELMELWTNQTSAVSGKYWWLSSANADNPDNAWGVNGDNGNLNNNDVDNANAVRPDLKNLRPVLLSKCLKAWSFFFLKEP